MSEQEPSATVTTKDMLDRGHNFAIIGMILSLFAFSISVTTPWILDYAAPPEPTIEEVVVEKTTDIGSILITSLFGGQESDEAKEAEAEKAEPKEEVPENNGHWTDRWSFIVIVIALGGIINGAFGYIREQHRYIGGTAIFFGMAAILVQYWMITLGIFLFLVLLVAILSSLGVEF